MSDSVRHPRSLGTWGTAPDAMEEDDTAGLGAISIGAGSQRAERLLVPGKSLKSNGPWKQARLVSVQGVQDWDKGVCKRDR